MPPQTGFDPSSAAQDKDFLNASSADKVKYLSAMDQDFAKASPQDQRNYIAHLSMSMQAPAAPASALSRVTAPYNPGANEFAAKHPMLGPVVRGLDAAGGAILGLPGALYHAAADPVTPEEAQKFGSNADPNAHWYKPNMSNIGPVGRAIVRTVGEPVENAASFYAGQQDIKPTARGVLSVLPEAIGAGVGTVAGAKMLKEAPRVANRIIPSRPRAGAGLNALTDTPKAKFAAVPVDTSTALKEARQISDELAVTGEKPHAVIQHYLGNELGQSPAGVEYAEATGAEAAKPLNMYEARTMLKRVNDIIDAKKGFNADVASRLEVRNLKRFAGALDQDISNAAEQAGFGKDYNAMRTEYKRGSQIVRGAEKVGPVMGAAAGAMAGKALAPGLMEAGLPPQMMQFAPLIGEAAGGGLGMAAGKSMLGRAARTLVDRSGGPPRLRSMPPTPEAYAHEIAGTSPATRAALAAKYGLLPPGEADRRIARAGGNVKVKPLPTPP